MVCGMVAYAITRRGADKMLKVTEKIYVPADNWRTFSDFYSVGIIHCQPSFIVEAIREGIYSMIGEGSGSTKGIEKIYTTQKEFSRQIQVFYNECIEDKIREIGLNITGPMA